MEDAAIRLERLTKYYGKVRGVEALDLEIRRGEIFGFLGPNGAGKTTTIRVLTGFLRPTGGRASVFGHDVVRESVAVRRLMGFVPGVAAPYQSMAGQEVLDYLGALQGWPAVLRRELCDRLELGRGDLLRHVREYSKGMQQKLAIVQALQHDAPLLILDEPTEGLDPLMQNELFAILQERQAHGTTVFMSSHILSEVERLCQRVAIIREGHLVAVEAVDALRERRARRVELRLKAGREPRGLLERVWRALGGAGPGAKAGPLPRALLELPGVSTVSATDRHVSFAYRGDMQSLVHALASLELEDVVVEHASLEEVFLAFYAAQEAAP